MKCTEDDIGEGGETKSSATIPNRPIKLRCHPTVLFHIGTVKPAVMSLENHHLRLQKTVIDKVGINAKHRIPMLFLEDELNFMLL
jgi:hypothetical protein